MKRAILLTVILLAAAGLSGCSYNDLTAKQQNVKGKWSNVESNLQRRADLMQITSSFGDYDRRLLQQRQMLNNAIRISNPQ